jgi:hypothetical protein
MDTGSQEPSNLGPWETNRLVWCRDLEHMRVACLP